MSPVCDHNRRRDRRGNTRRHRRSANTSDAEIGADSREDIAGRRRSANAREAEIGADSHEEIAGRRTQQTPESARSDAKRSPVGEDQRPHIGRLP